MGKAWSLEEFIRLANAAPKVEVPDVAPLSGRRRWVVSESARVWRTMLVRIIRSAKRQDGMVVPVDLPPAPLDLLCVSEKGQIQVWGAQPQGVLYKDFLTALRGTDATRIRECPRCGSIFWAGRKDKRVCSNHCRQRRWVRSNPERWADIQTRHEIKRGKKDATSHKQREQAERQRLGL
jgi:ribosomal protein S27AE